MLAMARHQRPQPPLTTEQLLRAFRRLVKPGWPQQMAEALSHPWRGPAIEGLARQLVREEQARAANRPPPPPAGPRAAVIAKAIRLRFDPRRAAANDREDD